RWSLASACRTPWPRPGPPNRSAEGRHGPDLPSEALTLLTNRQQRGPRTFGGLFLLLAAPEDGRIGNGDADFIRWHLRANVAARVPCVADRPRSTDVPALCVAAMSARRSGPGGADLRRLGGGAGRVGRDAEPALRPGLFGRAQHLLVAGGDRRARGLLCPRRAQRADPAADPWRRRQPDHRAA